MPVCLPLAILLTQTTNNFRDVVSLEKADGGDAGGPGFQTGDSVFEGDATEGKDGNVCFARFSELREAGGSGSRRVFFFEHGGEDGQVSLICRGLAHLFWQVARNGNQRFRW